jgi:hypothetical protein
MSPDRYRKANGVLPAFLRSLIEYYVTPDGVLSLCVYFVLQSTTPDGVLHNRVSSIGKILR